MYRIGEVWAVAGGGVGERMDGFIHADVDVRGTDMSWTAKTEYAILWQMANAFSGPLENQRTVLKQWNV